MRVEVSSAGGWHWNVKYDVWLVGTASWPNELLHTSTSCGGTCTTQSVYTVPRRLALACRGYSRNILRPRNALSRIGRSDENEINH